MQYPSLAHLRNMEKRRTAFKQSALPALFRLIIESDVGEARKGKLKRTVFTGVGLGCYKWDQSHTPSGMLARKLSPEGEVDTRQCASEDTESREGVDCEIPHWLERGTKHSL
ncbi:hypothetical protein SDJN02_13637, partial [Cucurbita argyrosperma subsp. argyrosperma]